MTKLTSKSSVYCDATFLVFIALEREQSSPQQGSHKLLSDMLINGSRIITSPLAFDEAWNSVKKSMDPKKIRKLRSFLRRKKLYQNYSFGDAEVLTQLTTATEIILNQLKFEVVQLIESNQSVTNTLKFMEAGIKPRDAFHLQIAVDNNATHFITTDTKLLKKITALTSMDGVNHSKYK